MGLTGGIGAGKSIVADVLRSLGYPVFDSDSEARNLYSDPGVASALIEYFGEEIYANGQLNKTLMTEQIFSDDNARKFVNGLIHPRVRNRFTQLVNESNAPAIFNEAAILFETGAHEGFDKMILVTAPEEMRIERVMNRDGISREQVLDRMMRQWSDEQKSPLADCILTNDNSTPLLRQIEEMLSAFNLPLHSR